ncbi:MAG TPA: hypothetical protein VM537_02515 [Anaerolineae bacterium]|nr:hypothetical protein [Anaerolineae bacterium]
MDGSAVVGRLAVGVAARLYQALLMVLVLVVPDPGEVEHMVEILDGEEEERG